MRTISLVACACLTVACQGAGEPTVASTSEALSGDNGDPQEAIKHPPILKWTHADDVIIAPIWAGDDDHGSLYMPQWRGAATGIEEYVWAPPDGDCRGLKGTVRVDWDSSKNTVRIVTKYRDLPKKPSVRRTEGVDYFTNPFHTFPKDFDDGVYRLWVIVGGKGIPANVYYDPATLDLLGSEFDFPNGPPNGGAVSTLSIPFFQLTGSSSFEPDDDGFAVHDYTIPYDHLQVESGDFSEAKISYVPFNLCLAQPAAPVRGQARPLVSPWLEKGIGPSWRDVLHYGVTFDVQIENPKDATAPGGNLPYIFGGVAFIGMPSFQGGVPNGYRFSLSSQIQNVTPIFNPVPNGNALGCKPYLSEPHVTAPNHCGP